MRPLLLALALVVSGLGAADTFGDIMAAHRKVVSRLSLSSGVKAKLATLDSAYEETTRADLQELVSLPKSSPRRDLLAAKMKRANSEYRAALTELLGAKWPAYQRAFAALVPSSQRGSNTRPGTSKGKAGSPTKKSKKRT